MQEILEGYKYERANEDGIKKERVSEKECVHRRLIKWTNIDLIFEIAELGQFGQIAVSEGYQFKKYQSEKYLEEKIKEHVPNQDVTNTKKGKLKQDDESSEDYLEDILLIQKKYLTKENDDQAVWVGGIMEVNLSLEEKAQKLAQMEEMKRGEYLKSIISDDRMKKKSVVIKPLYQQQQDDDEPDKYIKELENRFLHKGRIHKYQQYKKELQNKQTELAFTK